MNFTKLTQYLDSLPEKYFIPGGDLMRLSQVKN